MNAKTKGTDKPVVERIPKPSFMVGRDVPNIGDLQLGLRWVVDDQEYGCTQTVESARLNVGNTEGKMVQFLFDEFVEWCNQELNQGEK